MERKLGALLLLAGCVHPAPPASWVCGTARGQTVRMEAGLCPAFACQDALELASGMPAADGGTLFVRPCGDNCAEVSPVP